MTGNLSEPSTQFTGTAGPGNSADGPSGYVALPWTAPPPGPPPAQPGGHWDATPCRRPHYRAHHPAETKGEQPWATSFEPSPRWTCAWVTS